MILLLRLPTLSADLYTLKIEDNRRMRFFVAQSEHFLVTKHIKHRIKQHSLSIKTCFETEFSDKKSGFGNPAKDLLYLTFIKSYDIIHDC